MSLDKKDIINLADLAKLKLNEDEIKTYQSQLSDVLSYVEKINSLDLDKIKESLSGAEDNELLLRLDEVEESSPESIKQACDFDGDYVSTPQAINKK